MRQNHCLKSVILVGVSNIIVVVSDNASLFNIADNLNATMQELNGKIYREANTGLGKSDIIINVANNEFLIETKVYYSRGKFNDGKSQLAYYGKSLGLTKALCFI